VACCARKCCTPRLQGQIYRYFAPDDLGTPVFEAFKAVEIEVRAAGGYRGAHETHVSRRSGSDGRADVRPSALAHRRRAPAGLRAARDSPDYYVEDDRSVERAGRGLGREFASSNSPTRFNSSPIYSGVRASASTLPNFSRTFRPFRARTQATATVVTAAITGAVPARRAVDRAGQSGVVLGRYVYPDGQKVSLSGGRHGPD